MANFQRLVFAMGKWDAGVIGGGPRVLCEMGTGQCEILRVDAAVRIAIDREVLYPTCVTF